MYKKMYLCGPTLYSDIHVGNLRSLLVFDLLKKANPTSVYARNITDVDDKIIDKCGNQDPHQWVMENTYPDFMDVCHKLGISPPDIEPFASDFIPQIIQGIENMLVNDPSKITVVDDGVIFNPLLHDGYGSLSNRNIRKNNNPENYSWYLWKTNLSGFGYESPWGKGRPGWHQECSTMINSIFGKSGVDLHGGGTDLLFPHHECENAEFQTVNSHEDGSYADIQIAKRWFHIGMVTMDGQKMAKSTGNVLLVKDLLENWSPETIRTTLLNNSPTKPINFSDKSLSETEKALSRGKIPLLFEPDHFTPERIKFINQFRFREAFSL